MFSAPSTHWAEKQGVSPEQVDMGNMEAFLIQRGAYIDASFDEMIQAYGSVFRYIQDGLGLEETEIDQIKEELLE